MVDTTDSHGNNDSFSQALKAAREVKDKYVNSRIHWYETHTTAPRNIYRLVVCMAGLHVLAGEGPNPASAPTENASSEQCAEKTRNGVLEATAQHPNAGENQAAEADHGPGIDGEGLEGRHQRCCPGEVHRSLSMGGRGKYECNQRWR